MTREKGREGEGREGQGRGEGRYVILGSESVQNLRGTPFPICDFGIYFTPKPVGGTPLAIICDFGF